MDVDEKSISDEIKEILKILDRLIVRLMDKSSKEILI